MSMDSARELLRKAREQYRIDTEADQDNRRDAIADLRFLHVPGEQWDLAIKKQRGDRPCYEFNKLRITVKRIVNDMRANRPAGKVRGVEDGDVKTAEVYEGLIRNIWNVSDGDTAIDHAAEFQVGGGMGAWRITTEYSDDEAFEQDICIETIKNPLCLYWDAAAQEPLKRDARHWFLTSMLSKEVYEQTYPGKKVVSFETDTSVEFQDQSQWVEETQVRICEYWWKEPVTKTLGLLDTGETVDLGTLDEQTAAIVGPHVIKQREVNTDKVMMCIISGEAVLTDPVEWVGKEFPFIVVFGEEIYLDGRNRWFGLTRFAKDAQRSYNASRTHGVESVALAPQAKWWMTPAQIQGLEDKIAEAHLKNYPYALYNPDGKSPGPPVRMGGADIQPAIVQEMQLSSEDIKGVTGIFDNSLGKQANENSGVAIRARQAQGEIATFNYMDNMSKGIRRTWEVLVDIIPKIYDTQRAVRILGSDGAEDYVKLNHVDPNTGESVNDLGRGKYDVTVTTGPSFSTQRQEAAETYGELASKNPQLYEVAGDLIFKAMDLPYAQEIADRIKAVLPPQIQQLIQQGKDLPPEVVQAMMQVKQAMDQVQQHGQMVQQAAEEAQKEVMAAQKQSQAAQADKASVDQSIANLKIAQANLATKEAQLKELYAQLQAEVCKDLADLQTNLGTRIAAIPPGTDQDAVEQERKQLTDESTAAIQQLQQEAAQFMRQAAQAVMQVQEQAQPKPRIVRIERQNGAMVPIYDEGQPAQQ